MARRPTTPREIPQRELRNNVGAVLREVEAGGSVRVTVRGRPVADVVPLGRGMAYLRPEDVRRIVATAPLDPGFAADVDIAAGGTIDEI